MKYVHAVVAVVVVAFLPFLSWSADKAAAPPPELKTFQDKLSYVLGREVGQGLSESPSKIDLNLFMRGIQDMLNNRKSLVSPEEEEKVKADFSAQMQAEQAKKLAALADQNAKAEESFLAKNHRERSAVPGAQGGRRRRHPGERPRESPLPRHADRWNRVRQLLRPQPAGGLRRGRRHSRVDGRP
jgi:hypothetical protein